MAQQSPLKKTEAIRMARKAIMPPASSHPPQFVVCIPSNMRQFEGEMVHVTARDYAEAQHIRSYAVASIALVLMGLEHVPLAMEDGDTIDQLVRRGMARAQQAWDAADPLPFWKVELARTPPDREGAMESVANA